MKPLRILLAEDNVADVALIRHALKLHNIPHDLQVINDGAVARDFVLNLGNPGSPWCPDLLLLDLNLPKVDGTEVLREFRRRPQCSTTPVIVVSSSDASKDRAAVTALGIDHYFAKPSDWDSFMELGAVVMEIAARRDPHDQA